MYFAFTIDVNTLLLLRSYQTCELAIPFYFKLGDGYFLRFYFTLLIIIVMYVLHCVNDYDRNYDYWRIFVDII